MQRVTILLALALLWCGTLHAEPITLGQALPRLDIPQPGEIRLASSGEIHHAPWSSGDLDSDSRIHILQYMAGRPAVERRVRHFAEALERLELDASTYQLTSIVNLADVTLGASGLALREMEKNKPLHPRTILVGDAEGRGRISWNLQPRNVALVILDREGKVAFFREGTLDDADTGHALALITCLATNALTQACSQFAEQ